MGYSTSIKTLELARPMLRQLESGLECSWLVEPGAERQWAYKIREALYIAKLHKEQYPALAMAASGFKIVSGPYRSGWTKAVTAKNTTEVQITARRGSPRVINHGLDVDPHVSDLTGQQTAETIASKWFEAQPFNGSLYFPDAALPNEELLKLHRWTSGQHLIFFESLGAITLQKPTADLIVFSWDPSDIEDTKPSRSEASDLDLRYPKT